MTSNDPTGSRSLKASVILGCYARALMALIPSTTWLLRILTNRPVSDWIYSVLASVVAVPGILPGWLFREINAHTMKRGVEMASQLGWNVNRVILAYRLAFWASVLGISVITILGIVDFLTRGWHPSR